MNVASGICLRYVHFGLSVEWSAWCDSVYSVCTMEGVCGELCVFVRCVHCGLCVEIVDCMVCALCVGGICVVHAV